MLPRVLFIDEVTSTSLVLAATESAIVRISNARFSESICAYSRPTSLKAQA